MRPKHRKSIRETARNVLVLGVGGSVGQGLIEALRAAPTAYRIDGACIAPESVGLYLADIAHISPYAKDPEFVEWLVDICVRRSIHIVLSGQEDVLERMADNRAHVERTSGAVMGVDAADRLRLTRDKLRMNAWLNAHGFPVADTVALDDATDVEAFVARRLPPWIVKPRFGRGSAGVAIVDSLASLRPWHASAQMLLQEHLGGVRRDHTVAVLSNMSGKVQGSVAFERSLTAGTTTWARPLPPTAASRGVAEALCARLGTTGPCNLQFRHRPDGEPVCLDVNLRFSSTVALRAAGGFNDVDHAVRGWLGDPVSGELVETMSGVAIRHMVTRWVDEESFRSLGDGGSVEFAQVRRA